MSSSPSWASAQPSMAGRVMASGGWATTLSRILFSLREGQAPSCSGHRERIRKRATAEGLASVRTQKGGGLLASTVATQTAAGFPGSRARSITVPGSRSSFGQGAWIESPGSPPTGEASIATAQLGPQRLSSLYTEQAHLLTKERGRNHWKVAALLGMAASLEQPSKSPGNEWVLTNSRMAAAAASAVPASVERLLVSRPLQMKEPQARANLGPFRSTRAGALLTARWGARRAPRRQR